MNWKEEIGVEETTQPASKTVELVRINGGKYIDCEDG